MLRSATLGCLSDGSWEGQYNVNGPEDAWGRVRGPPPAVPSLSGLMKGSSATTTRRTVDRREAASPRVWAAFSPAWHHARSCGR